MRKLLLSGTLACALGFAPTAMFASQTVRDAQQALKDKGFDPGPIDGINGPKTHAATRKYQESEKLGSSGSLNSKTLDSLGVHRTSSEAKDFDASGKQLKKSYSSGGKDVAEGSKDAGKEVAHGHPIDASKDLGKGVGSGAKKVGVGTGHAAVDAAKGVKKAFENH